MSRLLRFAPPTLLLVVWMICNEVCGEDWLRFRGPNGSGISQSDKLPMTWSDSKNVAWRVALPGPGASSPIVLGNRVFITCYTGYGIDREDPGDVSALVRHLLCIDRSNGTMVWETSVPSAHDEDPYQGFITEHGYASSTPVTDGERVFVFFDKTGVVAFDMEGQQQWMTNLGTNSDPANWGGGASCILVDELLIVNAANVGNAIVALRKDDGSEVWRLDDPEMTNCWGTPIVVELEHRTELVLSVPGQILGIDPQTGEELWFAQSPIDRTVCASLVEADGTVYTMGGRAGDAIGMRCGGEGDVSDTHTTWVAKLRSGIDTPVLVDGKLFWVSGGRAYCADCETGAEIFKARLAESVGSTERRLAPSYASPIVVGDKIVMLSRSGNAYIIAASRDFNKLQENQLDEDPGPFNGTPAYSDGQLFLRSNQYLYCIAD